ncbi:MAG: hypothetical protein HOP29_17430 [Phycisphaerales bacterium]|nr:hypothetical protein [Phycisphaerales bacterium]
MDVSDESPGPNPFAPESGGVGSIPPEWLAEFEAAAKRPLEIRMRYAFIKTYKPVMDDAPFRAFDTMEDYRRWCEENLPDWLGYGRV